MIARLITWLRSWWTRQFVPPKVTVYEWDKSLKRHGLRRM
jgi:hypothetical protein